METLNAAIDLAAMIPNSFALVGFAVGILGVCIAYGRWVAEDDAAAALAAATEQQTEDAAAYRDAA